MDSSTIIDDINDYRANLLFFKVAKNTDNNLYILAENADKKFNTECPECKTKVIMCILTEREGEPLKYFRHKHKTSCQNYDISRKKLLPTDEKGIKETLEEIHNRTIDLIYNYLLSKKIITIQNICNFNYSICDTFRSNDITLSKGDIIEKEYSFNWNGNNYKADLAILDKNNDIKHIIEICHTHSTEEVEKPDNIQWCEIRSFEILHKTRNNKPYVFNNLRKKYCETCISENLRKQQADNERIMELIRAKEAQEAYDKKEKEEKAEKVAKIKEKVFQYLIDKNIKCFCCDSQITTFDYKCVYISYNDKSYKSDITICLHCYLNNFLCKRLTFKNTYPAIYKKELKKIIKKISN